MKKIMIVDDSRTIREQVAAALTPAGFEVLEAEDGAQGLDQIKATADLALVFCDLNMPVMDGLEMLEQVRRTEPRPTAPIVMLTTEGRTDLVEKAKRAGARGWLVKPFQPDHLVAVAKKLTATVPPPAPTT
jgi:two-component system, chemotaxis family, chemotaxis protein CheY